MNLKLLKKSTTWLLLLFVAVAGLSVITPHLDPIKNKGDAPDFFFEDVTIAQLDDGKLSWEMKAKEASLDKTNATQLVTFEKVSGTFMLQNRSITFQADTLDWTSNTQDFLGKGHVCIQSSGATLTGDQFSLQIPVQKIKLEGHSKANIESLE